jgi:hypothetical protein
LRNDVGMLAEEYDRWTGATSATPLKRPYGASNTHGGVRLCVAHLTGSVLQVLTITGMLSALCDARADARRRRAGSTTATPSSRRKTFL